MLTSTLPAFVQVLALLVGGSDLLAQMLPGMKRKAKPDALTCLLGPGAVLRYSGRTPNNMDGHADIYLTLHKAEARHMFSTFGWQKGQTDPQLVAFWHRDDFSSSSSVGLGGSMDSVGSSANTYWQFNADGTVGGAGSQVSIDSGGGAETCDYVVFDHTEGQVALKLTVPGENKGTYYIRQ